jgi:NADH-quinone oxidoreductase subunit K
MSIELMLNAANINFVTFAVYNGDIAGQVFALFSIAIAAAEVAVGLAILLNLQKLKDTVELSDLHLLRW